MCRSELARREPPVGPDRCPVAVPSRRRLYEERYMNQLVTSRRRLCGRGDRIARSVSDDRRDGLMERTIGLPTKGDSYGEARRCAPDSRGAASRGAGDRVGDFGFDAVVPGDRYGGRRRRRRALGPAQPCTTSKGGPRPPLLTPLFVILPLF